MEFFIFLCFMSFVSFAVAFLAYGLVIRLMGTTSSASRYSQIILVPIAIIGYDFLTITAPAEAMHRHPNGQGKGSGHGHDASARRMGPVILADMLAKIGSYPLDAILRDTCATLERVCVSEALGRTQGARSAAAELLGISIEDLNRAMVT